MNQWLLNKTTQELKDLLESTKSQKADLGACHKNGLSLIMKNQIVNIEKILKTRKVLYAQTMVKVWKQEVQWSKERGFEEDAIEAEKSYRRWADFLNKEEV